MENPNEKTYTLTFTKSELDVVVAGLVSKAHEIDAMSLPPALVDLAYARLNKVMEVILPAVEAQEEVL